jgi:hypothetical protein
VWGFLWLVIASIFFAAAIIVGIVAFKQSEAQQEQDTKHFLPVPGSHLGGAMASSSPLSWIGIVGALVGTVVVQNLM